MPTQPVLSDDHLISMTTYKLMSGKIGSDGKPSTAILVRYLGDAVGWKAMPVMGNTQNETFVEDIIILESFSAALVGTDMTMRKCCDTCASQCTGSGSTCNAPNPRMKEQKVASLKNSMETATKESRSIVTRYSSSSLRILLHYGKDTEWTNIYCQLQH